jgi:uncharacterized membrane protein YphA (DoxX/SURF4 family)
MPLSTIAVAVSLGRMILGGTFLLSGLLKLRDLDAFALAVEDFQLLPQRLVGPVALVVPFLELALGTALLIGWSVRPAAFLSILLLLAFAVAVAVNLDREREVACHCFPGFGEDTIGKSTLVRQGVLICCGLAPLLAGGGSLVPQDATTGEVAVLVAAAASVVTMLAWLGVVGAVCSEWLTVARRGRSKKPIAAGSHSPGRGLEGGS